MRPVLIDTNAYAAFKRGDPGILQVLQHVEKIAMSPVVLGELLGGFANGSKEKQNRKELHQFLESPRIIIYLMTSDTANFYSAVYSSLKKKGHPIPTNDMWIAAQTLEHGCILCTYDKHFNQIEGLLAGNTLEALIV